MGKLEMARNPNTSAETLALLAQDEDDDVRYEVAGNPSTSAETLALLAKDEDWQVRAAVAWNPHTKRRRSETMEKTGN